MAMQMKRAFNKKMMVPMIKVSISPSTYDANNHLIPGKRVQRIIHGVNTVGNRFSQYDEGEALHPEDGGRRFSNYRTVYILKKYVLDLTDMIIHKNILYNILQRSDEEEFGFYSYLIEKAEDQTQ